MHGKELPLFDVIGSSLLSPPLAVLLSSYARLVSYNQQDIYIHTYIYIYIYVYFFFHSFLAIKHSLQFLKLMTQKETNLSLKEACGYCINMKKC